MRGNPGTGGIALFKDDPRARGMIARHHDFEDFPSAPAFPARSCFLSFPSAQDSGRYLLLTRDAKGSSLRTNRPKEIRSAFFPSASSAFFP